MATAYRILGGLAVERDGESLDLGGPKQRAVLAALLLDPSRPVSPARLIDLVWDDDPPARAETSLQAYVSNLRRVLEPDRSPRQPPQVLVTLPAGYALLAGRDDVDATEFTDLAIAGHEALAAGEPSRAAALLDAALDRWRGRPLPELEGALWVEEAAGALVQVYAQAEEDRFEAGLELGQHELLVPRIESSISAEPFRERRRGQLALALYRSGRQRDALTALQEARDALIEEAGLEPGPELRQLEADILAQAATLDAPAVGATRTATVTPTVTATPTTEEAGPSDGHAAGVPGATASTRPFVGRVAALDALLDAYDHAARGEGRPVVVRGEPGIGKTRLVEELIAQVPDAVVAWGRCPETAGSAAYWPCIQIGRQLEGADALDGDLVAELLPDDAVASQGPAADRLALHLSITRMLGTARRPLVLVVDDLHWADPASLRLLEFVAAELRNTRALLIVTTRPVPADASPALLDCLGELARQPGVANLELDGLTETDVVEWLDARAGGSTDPTVADLVYDRTGGNPFFVGELVEMLAGEGRLDGTAGPVTDRRRVPAAVQDVIRRRVGRLPGATQALLSAASVIGRGFDVDLLADVTDSTALEVLDHLEPALEAGILVETDIPGRFAFSHALVNETLAAEISASRRMRLHARIADALQRLRADDLDSHASAVAFHAFEGAAAGSADQAVEWAVRSAELATAGLAFEHAASEWALALRALEFARPGDRVARFDALVGRARAHLAYDDVEGGYGVLIEAIDLAIDMGDPERVGRAASLANLEGMWFAGELGLVSADSVGALERALAAMPDEPSTERALTIGALAENAYWVYPPERLDELTSDALDMARALGDDGVLGRVLHKRIQALWRAATFDARADTTAELAALAEQGRLPRELEALAWYAAASVSYERGDVREAQVLIRRSRAIAGEIRSPALMTQLDFFAVGPHIWFGEFDEAIESGERAYELYRRTRRWAADVFRVGHGVYERMERDDVAAVRTGGPTILESQYRPWFGEAYAWALVELGELEEAREILDGSLPPLVDCWLLVGTAAMAGHTRAALGDRKACEELVAVLRPHVGRLATMGTGLPAGDVAFAVSEMAAALGDDDEARRMADLSVEVTSRSGDGPWLARVLLWRHRLSGDPADHARAAEIIEDLDLPLLRRRL